jgi:hypothetical protein
MSDQDLLILLRSAVERGDVDLLLDIRRQHHIDSPIYRVSDSSWAVYLLMIAVVATTYFFGWQVGAVAFVVAALIYGVAVRRMVAMLMRRRLMNDVLANADEFRKAWRIKGLGFRHRPTGTLCESPDGRWRGFILDHCGGTGDAPQRTT